MSSWDTNQKGRCMRPFCYPGTINIEVTTKCNFDCNYCQSKHYPDEMMSFDKFKQIVDEWLPCPTPINFNLTGEGEALLHPNIWQFVDYIKTSSIHQASFITNGSAMNEYHRNQITEKLDRVSISVDTMDADLAERVGRHMMDKVIANIIELRKTFSNITIMTVDFGQPIQPVADFAKRLKVAHFVQKIFAKPDYSSTYTLFPVPVAVYQPNSTYECTGLDIGMIAYNITGVKIPCCFIKDVTVYPGYDEIIDIFTTKNNTILPQSCVGCRKLRIRTHK